MFHVTRMNEACDTYQYVMSLAPSATPLGGVVGM